ncbi:MAG: MFS transporter [Planctomycetota bacterium]|jgi:MFS family permease
MDDKNNNLARSWVVVMTAGAFFFYSFIQMTLFTTKEMKLHFMRTLGIDNDAAMGNFMGTFLYGTVLFLIPLGVLLDKVSVKKLILAMLGLVIVCVFGLTYVNNVYVAMALRFLTGIAHCVAFMAPFRLAPRWFPSRRLALAAGLLVTFAVFGGWVAGAPMLKCINAWGAQTTMLCNGYLGIGVFVLALLLIRDFPEGEADPSQEESGVETLPLVTGLKVAAGNRQNWLAGGYTGLLNLSVLVLAAAWGTSYLDVLYPELTSETIAFIIGMIMIGTMIGSPLSGWVSDKLQSRKRAMLGGSLLSLTVMLAIILIPNLGAMGLYVLFLLLGILTAAQALGYPVVAESNDDNVLGTANGLAAVVIMGLGALGQPLFGQLVATLGGETADTYAKMSVEIAAGGDSVTEEMQAAYAKVTAEMAPVYGKAIWVMPIGFIAAVACVLLLRETFKRETREP